MAKQKSKKGKGSYAAYKAENRGYKNKLAKLEKHCKKFPNDEVGKKNLEKLKDVRNYKPRSKPLVPGSNEPVVQTYRFATGPVPQPKTVAEQISELFNIPINKFQRSKRSKPSVTYKKKVNVKKS